MDPLQKLLDDPRVTVRNRASRNPEGRCVVYWMMRSQRGVDHDGLNTAIAAGNLLDLPVVAFFAPVPFYPRANLRHYTFLAQGIPDIASSLQKRNVGFVLRRYPDHSLAKFCGEVKAALVVGDENPIRETIGWREKAARSMPCPLWTVDSDVIVPSKLFGKAQYAAHIMRRRVQMHLNEFLVPYKNLQAKHVWKKPAKLDSLAPSFDITQNWPLDNSVQPVSQIRGGHREAMKTLADFVRHSLAHYPKNRNHPETDGTSCLSPYLHFGHISPRTVALAVQKSNAPRAAKEAFLDQLITWRELAINFVTFNSEYDEFTCGEPWALRTLGKHAADPRPVRYSERQLENAETHDPLWNAAQMQMVHSGWMHNYVRMYWAKKILEWSPSPAAAYQIAVQLNDKYEMDGRDPNGYAGIAWSIVGKFDRGWSERPIFGTIRYMSFESTRRKFDSKRYIEQNLAR